MRKLKLMLLILFGLTNIHAATNHKKTFEFNGQELETFSLENILSETRYKTEQQDSTCEREVPYTDTVCEMRPVYDNVCHTIPGREECYTDYERQCRTRTVMKRICHQRPGREVCKNVTKYRQECSRGPSRRVCRDVRRTRRECTTSNNEVCTNVPGKRICHKDRNGRQVCKNKPGRRVCRNKPSRTCRDVPYTDRECSTVQGDRVCKQVPYQDRVCRTGPSREVCKDVPRTVEDCQDVPRRHCDWIPSKTECNVEQVGEEKYCEDITRYRTESYACKVDVEVPYEVTLKEFKNNCKVKFLNNDFAALFAIDAKLSSKGKLKLSLNKGSKDLPVIFYKEKSIKKESGKKIITNTTFDVTVFDRDEISNKIFATKKVELSNEMITITLPSQELTKSFKIELEIFDIDGNVIEKVLAKENLTIKKDDNEIKIIILNKDIDFSPKELSTYEFEFLVTPIFKDKVISNEESKISEFLSGFLFLELNEDNLNSLKERLEIISKEQLSSDFLSFEFFTHSMIDNNEISIWIDGEKKEIALENIQFSKNKSVMAAKIETKNLIKDWDISKKYTVKIEVEYSLKDIIEIPSDFKIIASKEFETDPVTNSEEFQKAKSDAKSFHSLKIRKRYVEFRVNKNENLSDLEVNLIIKKDDETIFEKTLKEDELKISDRRKLWKVVYNFRQFGTKLNTVDLYDIKITVKRKATFKDLGGKEHLFTLIKDYSGKAK